MKIAVSQSLLVGAIAAGLLAPMGNSASAYSASPDLPLAIGATDSELYIAQFPDRRPPFDRDDLEDRRDDIEDRREDLEDRREDRREDFEDDIDDCLDEDDGDDRRDCLEDLEDDRDRNYRRGSDGDRRRAFPASDRPDFDRSDFDGPDFERFGRDFPRPDFTRFSR